MQIGCAVATQLISVFVFASVIALFSAFLTKVDINHALKPGKMARDLKYQVQKVGGFNIYFAKTMHRYTMQV